MRVKRIVVFSVGIILILYLGVSAVLFAINMSHDTFKDGTTINGEDVSGLTCSQASEKLTEAWNSKSYIIKENGTTIGSISGFDFKYDIDELLEECLHPGFFGTAIDFISNPEKEYTIAMKPIKLTAPPAPTVV